LALVVNNKTHKSNNDDDDNNTHYNLAIRFVTSEAAC